MTPGRFQSPTARWAAPALLGLGAATLLAYALLWLEPLWLGDFHPFDGPALSMGPILGLDAGGVLRFALARATPG